MQNQQSNGGEGTILWLVVSVFVLGLLAWWLCRGAIVGFVFYVRHFEIKIIENVLVIWSDVAQWLHLPQPNFNKLNYWNAFISTNTPSSVGIDNVEKMSYLVGDYLRFPVTLILATFAVIIYRRSSASSYNHVYGMNDFRKLEVQNWPQISPVVGLNLVKEDIYKGSWAVADSPKNFCLRHKLVDFSQVKSGEQLTLDEAEAHRVFAIQLGPLWEGIDKLPIHVKALFVGFVACSQREREVANKIFEQISASGRSGKLDFGGVEKLVAKYKKTEVVKWLSMRHAYVMTFMASLLAVARKDGVLASSEFLWLKPLDRRLWYVLNTVGRKTSVCEVSGIFAHWLVEKKLARKLKTPMIQEATSALKVALSEILFTKEEDKWLS